MSKFIIAPHFRLHEWVAEEKGYFLDAGLDYEFRELIRSTAGRHTTRATGWRLPDHREGPRSRMSSCACHWTVNVAASNGHAKLYADAYSVAPSGIFVAGGLSDHGRRRISPACRFRSASSRAATIRRSRRSSSICRRDEINLSFDDGMLFRRMELLIDGKAPAAALFSGPYYFAEQLGFRKVIDTTFMIAPMINGEPDPGRRPPLFPRAAKGAARHRPAARALHALLPERVSRALPRRHGHAALGSGRAHRVRALHHARCSSSRSTGSKSTGSFRKAGWARAITTRPRSRFAAG